MMTNLFSIFDPGTSTMSLAWLSLISIPTLLTKKLWKTEFPTFKINKKVIINLTSEISVTQKNKKNNVMVFMLTSFTFIAISNLIALYPAVFSVTSHLSVTLPLSLTFWLSINMYGWLKNTSKTLSHLLPQGTPVALMAFMVVIELVSNIIRPITLCVRLTANLIAGHLLMCLLSNSLLIMSSSMTLITLFIPLILTILEYAVAMIQAYVFMTLMTLYSTETE